jgi:hypothetical protein
MEPPADGSGQQLGLVEPAVAAPTGAGRQPAHHLRQRRGTDQASHAVGQPRHRGAGIAVLEPGDDLARRTLVREQRASLLHAIGQRHAACRAHQRDARRARRCTEAPTDRAGGREQHTREPTNDL